MAEPTEPTISGDGVKMTCRKHGIDLIKTPDGYKCPKCDAGVKLSGSATIVVQ